MSAESMGAAAFEHAMASIDYPMFVVTASVDDDVSGCLVGFAGQVSISPARFLVCLSHNNHTYRVARAASRLAVHLLPRDRRDLARLFGEQTGDEVDKFRRCAWHRGPHGVPVLDGAAVWFAGPIRSQQGFGDHVGFLVEPDAGAAGEQWSGELLTFADVKAFNAGHDA